jgi:hypothetical protein
VISSLILNEPIYFHADFHSGIRLFGSNRTEEIRKVYDLVGILTLGARTKGRGYSRDHLTDLTSLGHSAGTALYMLQLNEKKRAVK